LNLLTIKKNLMATKSITDPSKNSHDSFGGKNKKRAPHGKTVITVGKGNQKRTRTSFMSNSVDSRANEQGVGLNEFLRTALLEDMNAQLASGNSVIIVEDGNIVEKWTHKTVVLVEGIGGTSYINVEKESKQNQVKQSVAVS
jgi:hypothetical protein